MTGLSGSSMSGAASFISHCSTIGLLFLLWWACNSIYAIDAQILLTRFSSELLFVDLTFAQILVGMLMATMLSKSKTAFQKGNIKQQPCSQISFQLVQYSSLSIGFFHLMGTIMTNSSYKLLGSTSTLMWKLSEPLAALVLKRLVLRESTPLVSVFGMVMVLVGVFVFSGKGFTILTVSPIVLANICFPMRNILLKRDQRDSSKHQSTERRYFSLQASCLPFAVLILGYKFIFHGLQLPSFPYLIRNAVLFNSYQFASIALLERMDALTHSLLNTLKRFTGILISAVVLGDSFALTHFVGLTLAGFGFPLYLLGKETDAVKNKKRRMMALALVQILMLAAIMISSCLDIARKRTVSTTLDRGLSNLSLDNASEKFSALPVSIQSLSLPSFIAPWKSGLHFNQESLTNVAMNPALEKRPAPSVQVPVSEKNVNSKYLISNLVSYPNAHIEYDDYEDALKDTGKNHGNLVWQFAAMNRLVDFNSVTTCNSTRMTCQTENSIPDGKQMMFYRPIANIFDQTSKMTFAFERLIVERDRDILLFVGIGIQQFFQPNILIDDLSSGEKIRTTPKDFNFTENAMNMLNTMQRYKMPMLVRGQFTLEAVEHAGYKYGVSTGCPSLFINQNVLLGRSLASKYEALKARIGDRTLKIALNMKPQKKLTSLFVSLLNSYPNSYMYAQTLDDLNQIKKAGIPFGRIKFISDAEEWMESLREMDVAFGARIHGNMIALGAGIPGFVIAPDHRVLELVVRMKVPHTTIYDKRLEEDLDVAKLITDVGFSGEEFDTNRCGIAKTYKEVFGRYGLRLSGHAEEISTSC